MVLAQLGAREPGLAAGRDEIPGRRRADVDGRRQRVHSERSVLLPVRKVADGAASPGQLVAALERVGEAGRTSRHGAPPDGLAQMEETAKAGASRSSTAAFVGAHVVSLTR
jgi:hypothetical protein